MSSVRVSLTTLRPWQAYGIVVALLLLTGVVQSWGVALSLLNVCIISAIMALGLNVQWGYAGIFNVGIMGFTAVGGLAGVLVSMAPVPEAWQAGGSGIVVALLCLIAYAAVLLTLYHKLPRGAYRTGLMWGVGIGGYVLIRMFYDPATAAIEAVDSVRSGYLGGLGLPILLAWPIGGLFAGAVAWLIGKIALGLRSDYLAIASLGISEIILSVLKNEEWLARGVKNVSGLPRPVPYEADLQQSSAFIAFAEKWSGLSTIEASSLVVKGCYSLLFLCVLIILYILCQRALHSPWGRMMRAIRDNEVAAAAMGKDIKVRHLQTFIFGCIIIGMAGAMLTTLDGQFTPGSYNPLRFTFLIWIMVIVGGSGNNAGAILGGFVIWFIWVQSEPVGTWAMDVLTRTMAEDNPLRQHLMEGAAHMRLVAMGVILLLVMRFSPRGLLPAR